MSRLRVLFAPDYRAGNPYQACLAEALAKLGIEVSFLSDYHRVLPLTRGARSRAADIVHIHWPEKYFAQWGDWWDQFRVARYPFDVWLTANHRPIVWTAHNLMPHNRGREHGIFRNMRCTARRSLAVFVHSMSARERVTAQLAVPAERVHVIPFGDHAIKMGPPLPQAEARKRLGWAAFQGKICLVFGTVSPYKGTDELIQFWKQSRMSHKLVVVGPVVSQAFGETLTHIADGCPAVDLRLNSKWLDEDVLRAWLSAADCVIFNYREIFTSGAAPLARSYGIPILIPRHLATVDLSEPDPYVFRFDSLSSDFFQQLERALAVPPNYDHAQQYRDDSSWERVAAMTSQVYGEIVSNRAG